MKKIKSLLKKFIRVRKEKVLIPVIEGNFLENRCALITGGGSGIGYSIAENFLKNGARVIITGRNLDKLEKAKKNLMKNCLCESEKIHTGVLDISNVHMLNEKFNEIIEKIDFKIDIFVNNAGINCGEYFPETKEEDYDKVLDTNLKGCYFVSQIFIKYMINNNIKGNLLNVTSSSSLRPAISPYILSKWGERSLTLGLAKKYLPYGITINGIAPGNTATDMIKKEDFNDLNCNYNLVKRFIAPEEVANIATILVSDMGKMIIGDTIYITGGSGIITYDDMEY